MTNSPLPYVRAVNPSMVKCAFGSGVGVDVEISVGVPVQVGVQDMVGDRVSDGDTVLDKVGTCIVAPLLLVFETSIGFVDWNDCPAPHAESKKKIPVRKIKYILIRQPNFIHR